MAKTKTKSKLDIKKFLLAKGEYLAMGVAGFFMVLLLLWGITKWSSAKPPTDTVKALNSGAQQIQSGLQSTGPLTEEQLAETKVPQWAMAKYRFETVPVTAFPLVTPLFDPTAKPDTKKENPHVFPIGAYQVDMFRGAMRGYDIIESTDGEKIGVIISKNVDSQDMAARKKVIDNIRKQGKHVRSTQPAPTPPPMGQLPGMGMGPMMGGPMMGGPMGRGGMMSGYGGGAFETGAQRLEKAIEYVPLDQLDKAIEKQKVPAMTVIPLRMVTIHAEIPLKRQWEELKRALRLSSVAEAQQVGPVYDGYDIRRRVTRAMPDGKEPIVISDWADYNFEDKYRTLIAARKFADNYEQDWWGYFLRYEQALALPLPQLVPETGQYPEIRLENILKTIQKLKDANTPKAEASAIRKRLTNGTTRGDLYRPLGAQDTGADTFYGSEAGGGQRFEGPAMPVGQMQMMQMGPGGTPGPGGAVPGPGGRPGVRGINQNQYNTSNTATPVEIEHLLLRFVDVNVEPGYTYQYQIRVRMLNPNFKKPKEVSKPSDADAEVLVSPWVELGDKITVPAESFLYAADWSAYFKTIKDEHEKEKVLYERLQVRENQAVVETATWMEQVKTGEGGKREPVGAWVVAEFPVARGEFIGRKTYVKLPLWSSENKSYVLREIPDRVIPPKGNQKEAPQPRGWLLDYTANRSVLVDFEGGKVRTKANNRDVTEEAATEMLVLRPDGRLVVRKSQEDEQDPTRKEIATGWDKWVKMVSARKASGTEAGSEFAPRPPGPGGGGSGDGGR